jgi:hypothetical protein
MDRLGKALRQPGELLADSLLSRSIDLSYIATINTHPDHSPAAAAP